MQYTKTEDFKTLKQKYDHLIAYGTGWTLKWDNLWQHLGYEAIIDGREKLVGETWNGIKILGKSDLAAMDGKILVVIYSVFEVEILEDIKNLGNDNIDTIFYKFIGNVPTNDGNTSFPEVYAKNGEDILILNQLAKLRVDVPQVLEIGVLHPINRNNTYLMNRLYSGNPEYKGVLVEANPLCWPLIEKYRKNDVLIKGGVAASEDEMKFTVFTTKLGQSTFNNEIAQKWIDRGAPYKEYMIKTWSINKIIEENFDRTPDVLSLDAEGLDFEILSDLNLTKYPIKIIVCETMPKYKEQIEKMMQQNNYKLAASTWENQVWVYKELWSK